MSLIYISPFMYARVVCLQVDMEIYVEPGQDPLNVEIYVEPG